MNHLPVLGDGRWRLPSHAHLVVYDAADGGGLLTIYDCGAAQKPPSARLVGTLASVNADHESVRQPTGSIVSMREPSALVEQDDDRYVVRALDA